MIAAGLDGIERQLVPPDPAGALGPDDLQPGAARFPGSLGEAATRLLGSSAASRTFGDHFVAHFAKACQVEHASLARAVSAAELARYIEG
jgi:glutamine synthetase